MVLQRLNCLIFLLLMIFSAAANERQLDGQAQSIQHVEAQIVYWYERGRMDRVEDLIQQLERVQPNHPRVLELRAMIAWQQRQSEQARRYYSQLVEKAPDHPATRRLREIVALDSEAQQAVGNAELLYLAGRYEEAVAEWRLAFPRAPENLDLAIQYWFAHARAGQADEAVAGLTQLRRANSNSVRLQLALIEVRFLQNQLTDDDYQNLARLSEDAVFGGQARALSLRIINFFGVETATVNDFIADLEEKHPEHLEISEVAERSRQVAAATAEIESDPTFQKLQRGLAYLANEQPLKAERWLREAYHERPETVAAVSGLGYATMRQGRHAEALTWFRQAASMEPEVEQWQQMVEVTTFWRDYGLFGQHLNEGDLRRAQIMFDRLQSHSDAASQVDLIANLQARLLRARATEALEQGDIARGHVLLEEAYRQEPSDPWLVATLVQSHEQREEPELAAQRFAALIQNYPSDDAWFAYSLYLARNERDDDALAAILQVSENARSEAMLAHQQRIQSRVAVRDFRQDWRSFLASAPNTLDEADSITLASYISTMAADVRASDRHYLTAIERNMVRLDTDSQAEGYAEASRFAEAVGDRSLAYQWAVRGIEIQRGESESASLWVSQDTDDWRIPGLQSRARNLISSSEKVLYLGYEQRQKSGTPGITELNSKSVLIDLRVPFESRSGYWFARVDPIWLDAGAADLDNTFWRNRFGTGLVCEEGCPQGVQPTHKEFGVALGIGADYGDWWFDVGRSPIGFNRSDWIGGVGIRRSLGEFGVRVTASRRIQTATLISFASIEDPFSERNWGAVTKNGIDLGASWDQGGRFGWWGNTGLDYYMGHQVEDNWRWYAFTGGYVRAFSSEPFALTVGLTTLFWGFDEDLSATTYGHGHYYSPEQYRSISVPLTVFGRINRFSYLVRGSLGYSSTRLGEQVFFPTDATLQEVAQQNQAVSGVSPFFSAGTGGGRSHSLTGVFEYQINRHWYVGLRTELIRSDTFAPNQGLIYLRYHFGGYDLPVARPPDPPSRYVDR